VTNTIYVPDYNGSIVTVIDGATNGTTAVTAGDSPGCVAVNPATGKVYVSNVNGGSITVIDPAPFHDTGVRAVMDPAVPHFTSLSQPSLTGKAVNRWAPYRTDIMGVVNDALPCANSWQWGGGPYDSTSTDSIGFFFNWGDSLAWGENYATFVPLEMMAATTNNLGLGTPFAGNMLVWPIYRVDTTAYGVEGRPITAMTNDFSLEQNRPNPFKRSTSITYQLGKSGIVNLRVYNIAGQLVKTIVDQPQQAGVHSVSWNGRDNKGRQVAAGIYFCSLGTGYHSSTKKMVMLK
jgi:DNA-binding beta-propeller fold protein YncE